MTNKPFDPYVDYFEDCVVHGKIKKYKKMKDPITGKYWRLPVDKNDKTFVQCDGEYYHIDEVPYWLLDE
jgi:hypothetical protein